VFESRLVYICLTTCRCYRRYVLNGFGLFTEGYTLFSIGNLTPLFQAVWPACWSTHTVCSKDWIAAVSTLTQTRSCMSAFLRALFFQQTYLQIIGIMVGQVAVGFEGDWIGRKFGLVQDALIMFVGLIMLTAMWGTSLSGWTIMYAWSLFIYGIGVGGE
jgi:hypothetical protein